jgi:hypothetical protein
MNKISKIVIFIKMDLVTPRTTVIILVVVVIAAIILTFLVKPKKYDESRVDVFMSVLAGLGIIVTFFFYFGTVELNERQQRHAVVQETARINDVIIEELMSELAIGSEIVPNFVASVTPVRSSYYVPPDPVTPRALARKTFLSEKIFSVWQDILISDEFTKNEPFSYITRFLQQANSIQLYEEWLESRIGFNQRTQRFGNLLFEYALPIRDQRPEVYTKLAKRVLEDPSYLEISKKS